MRFMWDLSLKDVADALGKTKARSRLSSTARCARWRLC